MTTNAHYEVRPAGTRPGEFTARTGSNTEAEFGYASGQLARKASLAEPGRIFEVRYRGWSTDARDLLVAAWRDGEELDIRTTGAREEHESR